MNVTTKEFDLRAWRWRMRWTQAQAAQEVGMSIPAYRRAEYRCQDRPGAPCNATLALLCQKLEQERREVAA